MLHTTFLFSLVLLVALVASSALAATLRVPYVLLLVLMGTLVGVIPNLPHLEFDSDIILLIFLPPLIFSAAWYTSWRDFRRELLSILFLAVGLVLVTTICVAAVAHLFIPGFSWPPALVLGAVVSPTDTVAVEAIIKRLGLQRRIATIIQGESLINDATALVAYSIAISAVASSSLSLPAAGLSLPAAGLSLALVSLGGVLSGLLVALPALWLQRLIDDPLTQIVITILTCFGAYLLGEALGVSGVLATVVCGLFLSWHSAAFFSPETRLKGATFWDVLVFLLNGLIFLLIGFQLSSTILPSLLTIFSWKGLLTLVGQSALICLTVILVRLLWGSVVLFFFKLLTRLRWRNLSALHPRAILVIGWSGMRGGVSMATALAVPHLAAHTDAPFPERSMIIFLTFSVILGTLLLQGLTLGPLIRHLGLNSSTNVNEELQTATLKVTQAALQHLDALQAEDWVPQVEIERLRAFYQRKQDELLALEDAEEEVVQERKEQYSKRARLFKEVCDAERREAIALRHQKTIDDEVFHTLEHHLDLEEQRFHVNSD